MNWVNVDVCGVEGLEKKVSCVLCSPTWRKSGLLGRERVQRDERRIKSTERCFSHVFAHLDKFLWGRGECVTDVLICKGAH